MITMVAFSVNDFYQFFKEKLAADNEMTPEERAAWVDHMVMKK